jgi:hypothetical protein
MRIAVCLSGQVRTAVENFTNIKDHVFFVDTIYSPVGIGIVLTGNGDLYSKEYLLIKISYIALLVSGKSI